MRGRYGCWSSPSRTSWWWARPRTARRRCAGWPRSGPDVVLMTSGARDGRDPRPPQITSDPALTASPVPGPHHFEADEYVVRALMAGASAFSARAPNPVNLLDAIRTGGGRGRAAFALGDEDLIARFVAQQHEKREARPVPGVDSLTGPSGRFWSRWRVGCPKRCDSCSARGQSATARRTSITRWPKLAAGDRAQLVVAAYRIRGASSAPP